MSVNRFFVAGDNGTKLEQVLRKALTRYNVEDYGAVHDAVLDANGEIASGTDDTSAIQDAIADAWANGGGEIFFPAGIYRISGALKTSVDGQNPNCQIYIPSNNNSASSKVIKFVGETPISFFTSVINTYPVPSNGVILFSDITGSGTNPSVFGGKNGTISFSKYFINADVLFENITIRVKSNIAGGGINMCGINAENFSNADFHRVRVDGSRTPTVSVAPSTNVFGIKAPQTDLNSTANFRDTLVSAGFKNGYIFAELSSGDNVQSYGNETAFAWEYCNHASHFGKMVAAGNKYGIGIAPGTTLNPYLMIDLLMIEMGPYSGKWYNPVHSVNDAGNLLRGKLNHATVEGGVGYNASKFTKNGGSGLTCTALY